MSEKAIGCFEIWYQELQELIKNRKGLDIQSEDEDRKLLLSVDKEVWRSAWEDGFTPEEALEEELSEWGR